MPGQELRKDARAQQTLGRVSRFAQKRVNERVRDIMSRRDAAQRTGGADDGKEAPPAPRRP